MLLYCWTCDFRGLKVSQGKVHTIKGEVVYQTTFRWHIYSAIFVLKLWESDNYCWNYRWWLGGILFWDTVYLYYNADILWRIKLIKIVVSLYATVVETTAFSYFKYYPLLIIFAQHALSAKQLTHGAMLVTDALSARLCRCITSVVVTADKTQRTITKKK